MAYEKKEGDISVFLNPKKTPENNVPNYNGQAMYNGELLNVSLWLKYPDGKPAFLTGKIEKHVPRDQSSPAGAVDPIQQRPVYADSPLDDDSPAPADTSRVVLPQSNTEEQDSLPF